MKKARLCHRRVLRFSNAILSSRIRCRRCAQAVAQCNKVPAEKFAGKILCAERHPGLAHEALPAVNADPAATIVESPAEGAGSKIGPYKIVQQIGEGGFGSVYRKR